MINEKPNDSKGGLKQQPVRYGNMNDGNIVISFSDSGLEVFGDFIPSVLNGKPLDIGGVTAILDNINVVFGVCRDNVAQALEKCNATRQQVQGVLVAKGEVPEVEVAEFFKRNPLLEQTKRNVDSKARINYRDHSPFTIVKQGQILATLQPRKPGKEGTTVHGTVLPFKTLHPAGVNCGTNTHIEGDKIVADIHGQLIDTKNVLSVQEYLVVKGAVGYRTGHITFPGDVTIDGPVSDGFKIYSGGTLIIKQTLDLTEVVTKGDIQVAGGIIGKNTALIKAGGGIKAKFIQNCRVAARNSVLVEKGIVNSSIFTMDSVQVGDKGMILGGEIYSVHGLRAGKIGKKSSKATHIHCGIDFSVQQEREKCNSQLRILAAKLARLQELREDPVPDAEIQAKMEELFHRLEKEQQTVSHRISELMEKVNTDEDAAVEVLGEIAPGTLIEICQVALYVDEPLRKARIRLDKANGKLMAEQL